MVHLLDIEESQRRCLEAGRALANPPPGDEIVISGCSGRFPNSDNVTELSDNLFNKVDLISDDGRRWNLQHDEIPQRTGKINYVSKFDAAFFGIHYKQAHVMDPLCRILLERAYEAIVDAGVNPRKLRGTRCGVFIGACFSESEKTWFYERMNINGFGILGSSRAMLSNRISYWLGTSGPSYTVDSACSSSLYAVEHAYKAIRDGICDSAIVGGCNLCLHPYVSLQFSRLGVLSPDGRCKAFDQAANGYCRAEAITVLFLQKSKDAKRVYGTIVHAKTNCDGYKEQGITYPSGQMQRKLLEDFYKECLVDPSKVAYIEAHGTGTKVGDPEECNALDQVFCPGRDGPLLIGSVKSNLGHTEPASGVCSIVKAIITMESGKIPPNLWFSEPKEGIPGFVEGRLKVVSEIENFPGGMVGVNSFGFGGANCHVLMNWNEKEKVNNGAPKDNLPRLINVSGRTEEAVRVLIEDIESRPIDVEYVRLLHDIHSEDIPGHLYRGFAVISSDRKVTDVQYYPGKKRPVWFIFSGLGSQWPAMGKSLINMPVFAAAIEKCNKVLQPKNIDIVRIITSDDPKVLENTLNAVLAVVAIQIGLVDVLQTLGITPDHLIGHSIGELGCSYADGSLTAEQAIQAAYYRALVSVETGFVRGAMAAVGMGYKKIKPLLPPEIEVACHNGPDSCTIVGPIDSLKTFVADLIARGVFTKEVPCSYIPYHSRYVVKAGPRLLSYLQKVIPSPKPRSEKWVSTSFPESKWNLPIAKLSSAEYHSNNFLSPVLFEEAIKQIPCEAITIEVAPHGLLQPILRRALNKTITNIALTQRGHADNVQVLLTGIGKLYEVGLEPQLANLYPEVQYPVSRGTPMISPLVRWDHRDDWFITSYRIQETIKSGERTIRVSLDDEDWAFVGGHVIDGRNLFPATGYIMLAWETLGMMRGEYYANVPVVFENVKFHRATNIPKGGAVEFTVMIQKGSGAFEVLEGGVAVVTGRLYRPENVEKEVIKLPAPVVVESDEILKMTSRDIYKELRLRGYNYSGLFRGLQEVDNLGRVGQVSWVNNWVAFMDNMLQIQILHEDTRGLYVPTSVSKVIIDPSKHVADDPNAEAPCITVHAYESIEVIKAGGVEIRNLKAQQIPRRKALGEPVLEKYEFTPHYTTKPQLDLLSAIRVCLHLALENLQGVKVKVIELGAETVAPESVLVAPLVVQILGDLPLIQAEVTVISPQDNPKAKELGPGITVDDKKLTSEQNCLAVVGSNIVNKVEVIQQALSCLRDNAFIIARESPTADLQLDDFHVLYDVVVEQERILLLTKKVENPPAIKVLKVSTEDDFSWLPVLKELVKDTNVPSILLVSQNDETSGLIGLVNCIRKEPDGEKVRGLLILDKNAPQFDIDLPFYADELKKGMAVSVFMNGLWGSYRHQALPSLTSVKKVHGYINNSVRGDLSSFKFFEGPFNVKLSNGELKNEDLITVYYCSINFRDVMLASGKLSADVVARGRIEQDIVIGFEFSGKTSSGKRVMGMVGTGAMSSVISADVGLLWEIPDNWTLAEAATIPVVFGTVRSSLLLNGRMKKGESVLIHAGTGGVGLAAIITAIEVGAEIFTTVGTQEKRDYILENFPQIPPNHIGNSRDTSFEHMIKRETNGRGVDLVLNSLSEEKLQASIRCLAKGGRFIEIGKFDIANNNPLGMEMFANDASFHAVMLDMLFTGARERQQELLELVREVLGNTTPLKTTIFPASEVEQAFRYMASGKHIGKVLLQMRDEEEDKFAPPEPILFDCVPKFYASASKSYIIAGGLGGFGLELADWLALRGAKNIVLTSRKGLKTGYQSLRIRLWKSYQARVVICTDDISTEEGVTNILNKANELGPVDGIFNLAVVLKDALLENQTEDDFRTSFAPKALATTQFDRISRKLCPRLEHFVIFSSVSCGRGNAGQTNYGMTNSVMERICEKRKAEGLPGLAIQWGAIGEVGLVAEMQEDHVELVIGGTLQQSISSCLQCLDTLLKQDNPVVASMVVAEKRAGGSGAGNIVDTVIGIMGIKDLKTVSLHSSLAELGMDSMMAVEIKQTLEREFEVFLTAQDIRGLTFAKLAELDSKGQGGEGSSTDKKSTMLIEKNIPEGIGYLLRLVCEEELAVKPVITLKETSKVSQVPVFLLPGLEGMATVFSAMVEDLNAPAHCLQFPYNKPAKSMQELASTMLPNLKSLSKPTDPVTLLGYSTGAFVAIEMALLLETEGRSVNLILVDGAPDFLQMLCKVLNVGETDDEIQNTVVLGVYNVLVPGTNEAVKEELKNIKKWEDKLEYARSLIPQTDSPHSVGHQSIIMIDLYHRLKNVMSYKKQTENKIRRTVTLIRPNEQTVGNVLKEDYNLSMYCERAVDVVFVEGNHLSMLDGPQVAEIVNTIHSGKSGNLKEVAEKSRPVVLNKAPGVEESIVRQLIPDAAKAL